MTSRHQQIAELADDMRAIRHDLHRHPEIGFEEHRTASIVAAFLNESGLEVTEQVGGTGVVGLLRGRRDGRVALGFRADMDALPIQEMTGLPYASLNPGRMHACGHDGHMAMLMGAARYLSRERDFAGSLYFIFQPAEESGLGGAEAMLNDDFMRRFPCDHFFGLHNRPGLPVGHFMTNEGPVMAAGDVWNVRFSGNGGHGGSAGHLAVDIPSVVAQFLTAISTIVARSVQASDAAVVSVGSITAGLPDAINVIPSSATIAGVTRAYAPGVQDILETRLREIATSVAGCFGAGVRFEYKRQYPIVRNDPGMTRRVVQIASDLVGASAVDDRMERQFGSEDFACFLDQRPGAFIMLGNGKPGAPGPGLHTPAYDFNDDALPFGIAYWVALAEAGLDNN